MSQQGWTPLVSLWDIATADHEGWLIEYFYITEWKKWDGKSWDCRVTYRGRPK